VAQLILQNGGLITKDLSAGSIVRWQISPFDAALNKIVIDASKEKLNPSNF
jgi:hypothetical protein